MNPKISQHWFPFLAGSLLMKLLICAASEVSMPSHFSA